jgi:hypothetical protein
MKVMKKWILGLVLFVLASWPQNANAQLAIAEVIAQAVKRVINAVDLKIQRLQNKTIWLQNAQKTLENEMSKLKLNEIRDWVEAQRKLYDDYFQELWQVKAALAYYGRVKTIIERQVQIVNEYRSAWALFRQDKAFTAEELDAMYSIYTGMLSESSKNIDGLFLVINAFATQMNDAKRLEFINQTADAIEQNLMDVKRFNEQNKIVSIQRATQRGEMAYVRRLYGIQ